jgi:hypothetical protein
MSFPPLLVFVEFLWMWAIGQYSRPPGTTQASLSGAPRLGQNLPARSFGVEIPDFHYGWPYFGFADHVK